MPARVRRKPLLPLLVAALVVLATAGAAAAGNGGLAPVTPNSPNAHKIQTTYYVVLGFTGFIFVLVESLLVYFAVKYRSRGRSRKVEGAQVHGHTRIELMWTAGPVVILAVIAGFVFYQLPNIDKAPAATSPLHVTVEGHQFYWQFNYPNGAHSINDLHVPVGQVVDLRVISGDVIHSWWIPALGGKIQAIPGRTNDTWFQPKDIGTFGGPCAELCGIYHASMQGNVVVESADAYHTYVTKTAPATLGKQVFEGVCATCHGMEGQGGYGPAINSNPTVISRQGLTTIVHNGFLTMPAVGDTWNQQEIDALAGYIRHHVYKGATTSGG
jgi:cytochrome c oxidase subunit 2